MDFNKEKPEEVFSKGSWYNVMTTNGWKALNVIASFFTVGIRNNEKCILCTGSINIEGLFGEFEKLGIDIAPAIESGQFQIKTSVHMDTNSGEDNCNLNLIKMCNDSEAEGYMGLRLSGEFDHSIENVDLIGQWKSMDSKYPISVVNRYNMDVFGVDAFFDIIDKVPDFILNCDDKIYIHKGKFSEDSDAAEIIKAVLTHVIVGRQRLKRENNILELLNGIAGEVAYNGNLRGILNVVLDRIMDACMADIGILKIQEKSIMKSQGDITVKVNMPDEFNSIPGRDETGLSRVIDNVLKYDRYFLSDDCENTSDELSVIRAKYGINSSVIVPVKLHDRVIGYLYLASRMRDYSFKSQIQFLKESMEMTASILYNQTQLFEMYSEVSEMEKMRALGVLTSGIAHEFNNLLTPILGFAQIINQKADSPELKTYVDMIEKSAKDGAVIVKRVQEFTRREDKTTREKYNLNELISGVINMTRPKWKNEAETIGKKISIKSELNSNSFVLINPSEIREVITNLMLNAIDAIQDDGEIVIKSWDEHDKVFFEVRDNGIGMSEEVKKYIFTPFFTTKKERGTGLGLAITYNIIHDHGGSINMQSKQGKGTKMVVRLPAVGGCGDEKQCCDEIYGKFSGSVLVVDDQEAVSRTTGSMLEEFGFNVDITTNGQQALNMYSNKKYKLVLCDLAMPDMTGIELAKKIKSVDNESIIILVSGWAGDMSSDAGEYIDALLSKPFTIYTMYSTIKKALREKTEIISKVKKMA